METSTSSPTDRERAGAFPAAHQPHAPQFAMEIPGNQRPIDRDYVEQLSRYFSDSVGSVADRLQRFIKYVPRSDLIRFLALHEIYKSVLEVSGAIIECGVHLGGGLMTWAQLSSIFEPINHTRRIIGFDTFSGFERIHALDQATANEQAKPGGYAVDAEADIQRAISIFDMTRPINHIPRVELVKGDALRTIPEFLDKNRHTVVALMHLDFDIYEPTKAAIEAFVPRMPKGAVIVFDELNHPKWPGETMAVLHTLGLRNLRIQRFPYQPSLNFVRLD